MNAKTNSRAHEIVANGFTRGEIAHCISSKRLNLTILPTERCNFRCTYCYEDFKIGRMRPEIVAGVKNLISRRAPDLKELAISWFGGEPLLALPVVREISAHAARAARQHGFHSSAWFTTNGYLLTPGVLNELSGYAPTGYQISLDGAKDVHDGTRLRADGQGTFDQIWQNLLAARDTKVNFQIQLRVHLTSNNFESLRMLMHQIRDAFGRDRRFYVDFQHLRDMGGAGGATVELLSDAQIDAMTDALRAELGTSAAQIPAQAPGEPLPGTGPATGTAEVAVHKKPKRTERGSSGPQGTYICYASKPNHWLIRADGRLGRCTVLLDDPRNDIGVLNPDGSLSLDNAAAIPWFVGFETLDPDALGCPVPFLPSPPVNKVVPISVAP